MILVDTNVPSDVVGGDPVWSDWSWRRLNVAAATNDLAVNDVVCAELSVGYQRVEELDRMLVEAGIASVPIRRPAPFLAGKAFQRYREAGGGRTGALPDFFNGAHAAIAASR